jgi:hypothetical protein
MRASFACALVTDSLLFLFYLLMLTGGVFLFRAADVTKLLLIKQHKMSESEIYYLKKYWYSSNFWAMSCSHFQYLSCNHLNTDRKKRQITIQTLSGDQRLSWTRRARNEGPVQLCLLASWRKAKNVRVGKRHSKNACWCVFLLY